MKFSARCSLFILKVEDVDTFIKIITKILSRKPTQKTTLWAEMCYVIGRPYHVGGAECQLFQLIFRHMF